MSNIEKTFHELDQNLRKASIAQVGGFRPPDDPLASWFGGQGVGLPGEVLPKYNGKDMFPLLQVNVTELPFVPDELKNVKLFVVFLNRESIPFDKKHGDGWLIREYASLDNLVPLPKTNANIAKTLPIGWSLSETEAPDWETAWSVVDLTPINDDEEASDLFFEKYRNYSGTKVGGWPSEIQHGLETEGAFVFQIGSEEKAGWIWADNGIGYFVKDQSGEWLFKCKFY
jgi:hypothetical protein